MTPQTLFSDDDAMERVELPPSSPTIETGQAKRTKQSHPAFGTEVSSFFVANDSISAKLLALEELV